MSVYAHAVLIVDGKYAMQLRDSGAKVGAGTWGLFGGGIQEGELARDACRREVLEELEIDVGEPDPLAELGDWSFYVADVTEQWPRRVLHEGEAARLFTLAEVSAVPRAGIVDTVLALHARRSAR